MRRLPDTLTDAIDSRTNPVRVGHDNIFWGTISGAIIGTVVGIPVLGTIFGLLGGGMLGMTTNFFRN